MPAAALPAGGPAPVSEAPARHGVDDPLPLAAKAKKVRLREPTAGFLNPSLAA